MGKRTKKSASVWLYRTCSFMLMLTLLSADLFVFLERGFFTATEAEAAVGSFSVFRNTSNAASITSGGGEVEVVWDTVIQENPDIDLEADETTISLADAGKYLVLYNVWTSHVTTVTNERRSFESYLTLNETPLAYGRGDGYIRNSNSDDLFAYAAGAAIVSASDGDELKVNIARDDTSTGGLAAIRTGTNGVSVLQLSDDLDYLRLRKTARSGDISANTSFTDVTYETADEIDTDSFAFTPSTGDVTLRGPAGSYFMVTSNVRLNQDAGSGARLNYVGRLTLDGSEIPGTRSSAYLRGNANTNGIYSGTVVYTGLVRKTSSADQTLNVEIVRENISNPVATDIVADETALSIVAIPAEAHTISLTSEAAQAVPNTQAPLLFDEQIEVESAAFSHSETVDPSRINIDLDGDYLFFSTVFAQRSNTGNGDRDPYRVEWRLDGVDTVLYGGHGSFLRGEQGTYDSYQAGSSGGVLLPNLTDTQFVELTMFDEVDDADAEINNDRVALQGVEISGLIPVTATEVSVSGTQPTALVPNTANIESGEQYVILEEDSARNVTSITLSENGTIAADTGLANVRLYYDIDTSAPYDCSSESYGGNESQYGATSTFSGADGTISFAGSETVAPTQSMCVYVVFDTTTGAADGDTINTFIDSPATDVVVTAAGTVRPFGSVGDSFSTIVDAEITQANYHWRNDDGSESGASSATGGVENAPGLAFAAGTPQRLRLGINAQGTGAQSTSFRLEYGENVTTCGEVSAWTDVGASGGAWDMADSVNVFEGENTTNISVANGGVSDGVGSFVTPNGGVRDASSQTGTISITAVDFVELEYSIQATLAATEGVAYCFRVVNAASAAPFLAGYDERVLFTVPAASVDATLTDFPVYVDLADLGADFWAGVQNDGDDIRVTTGDALSEVPVEVVSIDTGAETGELHFRAPSLSDTTNTQFYIYFGDATASAYGPADPFGRNNVWSNGFEAVYHLAEDPSGAGPQMIDSTGNGRDLTAEGTMTGGDLVPGQLGQGIDFDGVNDALRNAAWNWTGDPVTVTYWNNVATAEVQNNLTFGFDISGNERFSGHSPWGDSIMYWDYGTCCGTGRLQTSFVGQLNQWSHVSLVSSGSSNTFMGIYFDSVLANSKASSDQPSVTLSNFDLANGQFDGRIDEFRIAEAVRSADWIAAEYSNQDSPSTFYLVGAVETPTSALGAVGYSVYPEATLSADISVSSIGTQVTTVTNGSTDTVIGGTFVISSNSGAQTVTDLTITETGSIDAQQYLLNPRIGIDFDTTAPYNCVGESYDSGTDVTLSGSTFIDSNGTTTVSGSAAVNLTQTLCAYVLVDVATGAPDGATIEFEISLPNVDVIAGSASVGPGSSIELAGSTTVLAPALAQANYHWRNDNGGETGATSASGGTQNTPIFNIFQDTQQRLRFAVSNDGSAAAAGIDLRLEYGTKITTCENVGSWERVDTGIAFDMDTTSQLVQGNNTTNISEAAGGVGNPNATFLSPNSAQLETVDELTVASLTNSQYIELEYALTLTDVSAFGATYCFRLTDAGAPLATYTNYPELTVQERQDFLVQRGTEVINNTTSITLTAGVDYVAPASNSAAFVRITDTSMTAAGSITLGQTRQPDDLFAYIEGGDNLTSSFSIVRPATAAQDTRVQWEIVEYVGVSGGDNEFVVRDAGEVTYGGSSLFATGTAASGVVDDAAVVVFISGQFNPATGVADYNTALSISSWDAAGDRPVFERGDADGVAARVGYAVVEFTGANWNVQRAEHTFTAAGVTETQAISAVNSLSRTFVHTQKLSGNELVNLDESGHEVWLSSIGAVSFQLEGGSTNPNQQRSVAWVIENTQLGDGSMAVYRSNGFIAQTASEPNSYIYNIGATIEPANASIWANTRSTGAGSAHPRAQLGARILNATQFELWKSDEGQNQNFRVEVVDWPVAETSIRQANYRFYVDNDLVTPSDPWPPSVADLGENTAMTDIDEPLGAGERVRIRMALFVNNASLVTNSLSFKLQYARRVTTCSAVSTWDDIGVAGSGEQWRGFDAVPTDGLTLPSTLLSVSDVTGSYQESNPSSVNQNGVAIGEYIEYDWLVENNAALQKSSYCFRMVESDGAVLDGYDVYPTARTSGYTPIIDNWRWYDDESSLAPASPLAGERVAVSDVGVGDILRLRVSVPEIEGASGQNVKFNLQYSEYPDFSDGGTLLTATSSCSGNSLWCYADGAGEDNELINTATLGGVDACVSGVGNGCGTRNEAQGLSGVYNQPAFAVAEHEFTLQHDGARVNRVYYFRLVDATNGTNLLASSSFPSVSTEGAVLTFVVSGVDANSLVEGITTDATTTATDIGFGSLPIDTEVEVAQRLTVFTNGTEGYRVFMEFTQGLLDSYGNTIQSIGATNMAPASWESQCTALTASCFGYHAGDNILYDGSVRFATENTYAGVELGPVEVMASNVPVTFDVSEVVYRTRVGMLQPAGDYTAAVRYIIVPIF